jgi:Fur family transcriptional regulator, ferric uptake regulator
MNGQSSQRNTRQRQIILEELQKLTSHPTAAVLYEIVRRRLPKISLGTVYRNLELLARTGLILKLDIGGSEARFDGNVHRHDHVRCVQCGRVDDIHGPPLDLSGGKANDFGGYTVSGQDCPAFSIPNRIGQTKPCGAYQLLGYRLQYFGVCPQCRAGAGNLD